MASSLNTNLMLNKFTPLKTRNGCHSVKLHDRHAQEPKGQPKFLSLLKRSLELVDILLLLFYAGMR